MNWLRRLLGLCVHRWCPPWNIYASDGSVVGYGQACCHCPKQRYHYYPEGH